MGLKKGKFFKVGVIVAVVLALLAGGFFIYSKNFADADISNDGEFAVFSKLTDEEIRAILFDAYISNMDKVNDYTEARKPIFALYDDLKSGKVSKVPLNLVAKRKFWRDYWDGVSQQADSRSLQIFRQKYSMQGDPTRAYAATIEERNKHLQTEKLRNQWRKKMVELGLGDRSKLTTAWISLREAIDSGNITELPNDQELTRLYNLALANGGDAQKSVVNIMPEPVTKPGQTVEEASKAIVEKVDQFIDAVGQHEESAYKDPYSLWLYQSAYELHLRRGGEEVVVKSPADLDKAVQTITPARNDIRKAAREIASETGQAAGVELKPSNPAEDIAAQISLAMQEEAQQHRAMYDDNNFAEKDKSIQSKTDAEVKEIILENDTTGGYFNGPSAQQEYYMGWPTDAGFDAYVKEVRKTAEAIEPPIESAVEVIDRNIDRPSLEETIATAEAIVAGSPAEAAIASRNAGITFFTRQSTELPDGGNQATDGVKTAPDTEVGADDQTGSTPGSSEGGISGPAVDEAREAAADNLANSVYDASGNPLRSEGGAALKEPDPVADLSPSVSPVVPQDEVEFTGETNNAKGSPAQDVIRRYFGTGKFGINPKTGNFEYTTTIIHQTGNDQFNVGYISFDPLTKDYTAQIPYTYKGKDITFYSQPRTGDVFLEFANHDGSPLVKQGKVRLFSTKISKDGMIGGTFAYQNRVFSYNPNTKALEIPIAIAKGGKISPFSTDQASKGMIYLDTKGNVTGSLKLSGDSISKQSGTLFFDRNGSLSYTHEFREISKTGGVTEIASVSLDAKGNISGVANVGKLVDLGADVFVSVGKGGISGVNVPIGSALGQAVGFSIGKDGGISLTSAIPIAGIPLPISLGQDAHGNFAISIPFVGTLVTFGHENRPLWPPEPKMAEDGGLSLDYIYSGRHSLKKAFKTIVVYQTPMVKISPEEQKERSKIIFEAYNKYLRRNPSTEEYFNWYIYGGHMPEPMIAATQTENSKLRLAWLRRNITGEGNKELNIPNMAVPAASTKRLVYSRMGKSVWSAKVNQTQVKALGDHGSFFENGFPGGLNKQWYATVAKLNYVAKNPKEFEWIMLGNPPEDFVDRPQDIMGFDPFSKVSDNPQEPIDNDSTLKELLDRIEKLAKSDPEFQRIYENLTDSLERISQGSATTTATQSPTVTPSESATVGMPVVQAKVVLSPGYNTLVVEDSSDTVQYLPINTFDDRGLTVFEYQSGDQRKWLRSDKGEIKELVEDKGYYVYNPTNSKMEFFEAIRSKTDKDAPYKLGKGWNLIANSTREGINTKKIDVLLYDGTRSIISDLVVAKKVYSRIYEVKDAQAKSQEDHFEVSTVIQGKTIEPSRIFWTYAW